MTPPLPPVTAGHRLDDLRAALVDVDVPAVLVTDLMNVRYLSGFSGSAGRLLVIVNYGPTQGQCYVSFPWADLRASAPVLHDILDPTVRCQRDGGDLLTDGLYVDVPAWAHHVFEVIPSLHTT